MEGGEQQGRETTPPSMKPFAAWDKTGLFSGMMAKMGFKGSGGLGVNGEGISQAISVQATSGRQGLGSHSNDISAKAKTSQSSSSSSSAAAAFLQEDPIEWKARRQRRGSKQKPLRHRLGEERVPEGVSAREHLRALLHAAEAKSAELQKVLSSVRGLHESCRHLLECDTSSEESLGRGIRQQHEGWRQLRGRSPDIFSAFDMEPLALQELEPLVERWERLKAGGTAAKAAAFLSLIGDPPVVIDLSDGPIGDSFSPPFPLFERFVAPWVRRHIRHDWHPATEVAEGMELLGLCFSECVPAAASAELVSQSLLPRLLKELRAVQPLPFGSAHSLHVWLQPWVRILPRESGPLLDLIEDRLSLSLSSEPWPAADADVADTVELWASHLGPQRLTVLLQTCIYPHLSRLMDALEQQPGHTRTHELAAVLQPWGGCLSVKSLATAVELFWFPKWRRSLESWLCTRPPFAAVRSWYMAWRASFPPAMVELPSFQKQLRRVLEVIDADMASFILDPANRALQR